MNLFELLLTFRSQKCNSSSHKVKLYLQNWMNEYENEGDSDIEKVIFVDSFIYIFIFMENDGCKIFRILCWFFVEEINF